MRNVVAGTDDDGQISVLLIGYLLLSLLVVSVVMAASAVYIEHKKLLSAADGASLAAADSFGVSEVDAAGGEPQPGLTAAGVKASARGYLERSGAAPRFNQLALDSGTGAPDAQTARVVLTAVVHPPVVNFLIPAGIPITAVAEARPTLTR